MFEKRICATAPWASVAERVSVAAVLLVAAAPPLITTLPVVAWLSTLTVTGAEVCVFPEVSRARAVSTCVPDVAVVVSQVTAYGAAVSSAPRFAPSSRNCTPATARLSVAVAVTLTAVPSTVAPFAGAVTATVGGVVSPVPLPFPTGEPMSAWISVAARARA